MSVRNGNINVKWLNELRADTTARFMHEVYMHALDNASASGGSYLVLDDSQVSTRTGAQVLSDIGALSTSGTAAASSLVAHVNQALDSTCFVSFATAATGNLAASTNTALTFNSTNGDLGATTVTTTSGINAVGTIHVDGTASQSARLELSEDTDEGAHFVRIGVPALAASTNFLLPNDEGTDGYFLKTDGSGNTSWAASSGGIAFDGSTANGVLTYKDADEATVEANMTYDGADLTLTSATSGKPILTIENSNTDAVSPILKFAKTATGADADEIGRIQFEADDDANNPTVFAEIKGEIQDVTNSGTSEDGQLELLIAQGASLVNVLKANSNVGFGTILELGDNGLLSMTQFKSTVVQFESSTSTGPIMSAVNTTADAEAPQFTFIKNRGNASGVGSTLDGDHCGLFNFRGYDAAGNITTYAWIEGTATTTSSTNEAGKIAIAVTSDGNAGASNRNVITGTGHTTTDKVDVDLGYGTASTTTIAGDLQVAGGDIYGPTDADLILRSDDDISLMLDDDNDGSSRVKVINGASSTIFTIDESGNVYAAGTIDLGHASDTTIARSAAGKVTIEGNQIVTAGAVSVASEAQAPIGMQIARRTITQAEANAMNSTPIEIVPAQGANTIIVPHECIFRVDRALTQAVSTLNLHVHYADLEPGVYSDSTIMYIRRFMYNEGGDRVVQAFQGSFSGHHNAQNLTDDVNHAVEVSFSTAATSNCFTSIDVFMLYHVIDIS